MGHYDTTFILGLLAYFNVIRTGQPKEMGKNNAFIMKKNVCKKSGVIWDSSFHDFYFGVKHSIIKLSPCMNVVINLANNTICLIHP